MNDYSTELDRLVSLLKKGEKQTIEQLCYLSRPRQTQGRIKVLHVPDHGIENG